MYAHALDSSDLGDADLIAAFQRGDDAALETLLRRHADDLYRFCCHLVPNREDAEDICQESLVRAIDRVETLQSGAAFRGWLFRIARNLSVDWFRSGRRTCPLGDEGSIGIQVDGPHERVEVGEECQRVSLAFRNLKESHRKVLVLREVESLSYAEIGTRLNLSQSAVETLLFRARRRLREEYVRTDARILARRSGAGLRAIAFRFAAPLAGSGGAAAKVALTAVVGSALVVGPHLSRSSHPPTRSSVFQPAPLPARRIAASHSTPGHTTHRAALRPARVTIWSAPQQAFLPPVPRSTVSPRPETVGSPPRARPVPAGAAGSSTARARLPVRHQQMEGKPRWLPPAPPPVGRSSVTTPARPAAPPVTTSASRVSVDARPIPPLSAGVGSYRSSPSSVAGLVRFPAVSIAAPPTVATGLRAPVAVTRVSPALVLIARAGLVPSPGPSVARLTAQQSLWQAVALVSRSR